VKRLQEEMRRTILDANNQIALVTTLAYFGTWARPQEFLQGRGGSNSNLSLSSPSLPFPSSPSLPFLSLLPSPPCPPLPRREAPPLNPGKGPGRASKAPPAGSGAAPLPKTHLGMFSAGESCLVATTLVLFLRTKMS